MGDNQAQKGALDAKRGKIFTRLIKEEHDCCQRWRRRSGSGIRGCGLHDSGGQGVGEHAAGKHQAGRSSVARASLKGVSYEEAAFEGYGPGGVAVLVDVLTDNRNRAVSEIRHAYLKKWRELLAKPRSVKFMFAKKGLIAVVEKSATSEEKLMDIVLQSTVART